MSAATVSILAAFAQANPSADYGEALKAKAQGDYASAAALFKSACYEGGNDLACKELGEIYESGRGSQVSKNMTLANEAYNKCCDLDPSRSDCCSAVGREVKSRRVLKAPERPKDSEELVIAAKECQEGSTEQ